MVPVVSLVFSSVMLPVLTSLSRSDNYYAARSISCTQAAAGGFRKLVRPFGDERSNKSHDDLSHVGEEMDDFSLSGSSVSFGRTAG